MNSLNLLTPQHLQQPHNAYHQKQITTNLVSVLASCDGQSDSDDQQEDDQSHNNQNTTSIFHNEQISLETNKLDRNNRSCSGNNSNNLSQLTMRNELSNKQLLDHEKTQQQQLSSIESLIDINCLEREQNSAFDNKNTTEDNIFTSTESKTNSTSNKNIHNNDNIINNNSSNNGLLEEFNSSGQNISEQSINQTSEQDQNSIENKSSSNNDEDDDESFVALCTDASSVLNNDPSRRYYINKLYQPLNGQHEDQLVEHDDEYLLYQELRYLESNAQELTKDRERVQLTRILEDDDGDDDQLDVRQQHEDPLDRLQMTTIIETFESFPTSPLIDNSGNNITDPLIGGSCDSIENNHQICSDKPDSTIGNNSIIISSAINNNNNCENNITTTNYNTISTSNDHQQNQFNAHNIHRTFTNSPDSHQNHFYPTINDDNSPINESQLSNHQYHLEEYNHQDNISENCFNQKQHQVTSTFVSSTYDNTLRVQEQDKTVKSDYGQVKKRGFQQISTDDQTRDNPERTKVRTKKRRSLANASSTVRSEEIEGSNNKYVYNKVNSSSNDVITSSKPNNTIINKTNEYQEQHIKLNNNDNNHKEVLLNEDDSTSLSSGTGGRRNPHMSKYRRRTANARERIRMREINQAFEKLKKVVPIELIQQSMSGDESDHTSVSSRRGVTGKSNQSQSGDSQSVKLTKITTLRLAVSYIAKLSEVLSQHQPVNGVERVNLSIIPSTTNQSTNTIKEDKNNSLRKATAKKKKNKTLSKNNSQNDGKSINSTNKEQVTENTHKLAVNNTKTIVLNQPQQQQQPIIITNQYQSNTSTLVSLQQQKPQQSSYGQQCINNLQQPLTIPHGQLSNNILANQDRTYVTPVAVAILGIPTNNAQNSNGTQGLQLLGIQGTNQQTNAPSYNLITQHPQHVTLTLDDLNGLSVLRLANNNNNSISVVNQNNHNQGQTFQIQQNRPTTIIHQQAQILANGYNYTTYQPLQFSQFKQNTIQSVQSNHQPATATIQFRNTTAGKISDTNTIQYEQPSGFANNQQQQMGSDKILMIKSLENNNINNTTNTGIISDCRNFSISPTSNIITQNLNNNNTTNNNNNNFEQTKQLGQSNQIIQQNYDGHSHSISLTTDTQNNKQVFQTQQMNTTNATSCIGSLPTNNKTNLIYINSSSILKSGKGDQASDLNQHIQGSNNFNLNSNERAPFEQIKFVTQFQRQDANLKNHTESNINQLVASLATSIQPKEQNSSNSTGASSEGSSQQQQQQHKRTYRFHNYDGNMITNNLYGCHDRQQYNQTNTNSTNNNSKRCNQNQDQSSTNPVGSQRSRQNSLSSTCSTISSSSSLTSLSTSSPLVSILVKSPTNENENHRNTTSTA